MRRLILAFLCLAQTALAGGNDLIAQVNKRLQHPPVLRGQFQQEKSLAGFTKPVKSQGKFTVVKGRGIIWRTETPFASQLVLTRNALVQTTGSGAAQRLDAQREPALKAINTALFAVLSGDLNTVERYFEITGRADAREWTLHLKPRETGWRQFIDRIELKGAAYLNRLEMLDANGDTTLIRFLNGSAADAPNTNEAAQLE